MPRPLDRSRMDDRRESNPLAYIGPDRPHTPLLDAIRATAAAKNRAWSDVAGPALIRMAHLAADLERRSAAILDADDQPDPTPHAERAHHTDQARPVLARLHHATHRLATVTFPASASTSALAQAPAHALPHGPHSMRTAQPIPRQGEAS